MSEEENKQNNLTEENSSAVLSQEPVGGEDLNNQVGIAPKSQQETIINEPGLSEPRMEPEEESVSVGGQQNVVQQEESFTSAPQVDTEQSVTRPDVLDLSGAFDDVDANNNFKLEKRELRKYEYVILGVTILVIIVAIFLFFSNLRGPNITDEALVNPKYGLPIVD